MQLPIYEAKIDFFDEQQGVYCVSLVDAPAVGVNFVTLSQQEMAKMVHLSSDEKMEVFGVALIPDKYIYRNDNGFEYYLKFSAEDIEKIALKFFTKNATTVININHNGVYLTGKAIIFESYIVDRDRGKTPPEFFSDVPNGTWLIGMKILDTLLWEEIKKGNLKGFSVEGFFSIINVNQKKEEKMKIVRNLLKSVLSVKMGTAVTDDGKNLEWVGEGDLPKVGDTLMLVVSETESQVAPAGDYLVGNFVIVVGNDGKVVEVKEKTPTPSEQDVQVVEEMKKELEAINEKLKAFDASKNQVQTALADVSRKIETLEKIIVQFSDGKKPKSINIE